jgi:hypothetical protein
VLLVLVLSPAQGLPQAEVDNYYFDADHVLIGEFDIFCDGTHYAWGTQDGAVYRSTESASCSGTGYSQTCYEYYSCCGWRSVPCVP